VAYATQGEKLVQKSDEHGDLRVRRTRKLLREALIELTIEKGFSAVTVRDITERAMVNRSTFYRHYLDKYDLLKQYIDELQEQVSEAARLAESTSQTSTEKVPAGLLVLVKHVQEYAQFYRVMLGRNGDPVFTALFRQMSERRYRYLFAQLGVKADPKEPPVEMKLNYIANAGIGAFIWWLDNDQPCSAEQLAIWLGQLSMTSAGLKSKPSG
jgi:AcrR family transcriptional regulator